MSEFLIYQSEDGRTKLDVRLEDQMVWLSQKQFTELFGKAKGTISEHIKHIFADGELDRDNCSVRRWKFDVQCSPFIAPPLPVTGPLLMHHPKSNIPNLIPLPPLH
jgi:hypothetical protein